MEEKKKNKNLYFFKILFVLFIVYICVYAIGKNGFVERKMKDKTLYTEEQIRKFESDVENGQEVDVNAYLDNKVVDYSNSSSKLGENVSNLINKGASKLDKMLNSVFSFLFE